MTTIIIISCQKNAGAPLSMPSPDGAWIASVGQDHTVVVFSATTGEKHSTYYGHQDGVYRRRGTIQALAWSPDGQWIASASSTGSVHTWAPQGIHQRTVKPASEQSVSVSVKVLQWNEGGLQLLYEDEETRLKEERE